MAIGVTDNPDGDNQAAGALTQTQVQSLLVEPLEQESRFLAAGPKIFDTDGSPVRVPTAPDNASDDLEFVGENEKIPELDREFGEILLLPSEMKSVKTLTRFSNELARQSVVGLEQALRQRLVADVAGRMDQQLLGDSGDGTTTPKGLFAYSDGDGVLETDVADWDIDAIMDAQGALLGANADPDSTVLFISPSNYMDIRRRKDNEGRFMLTTDPQQGGLVVPVLGAKAFVSAYVPDDRAALVDMSQIAVARDVDPAVTVLSETFGQYDQQALRVVTRLDMKPMQAASVVLLTASN